MPVVFLCQNCRSRLKITRRKIGAQIECPRCQAEIIVPTQEAANASMAMAVSEHEPPEEPFPEFMVFDDPAPPRKSEPPQAAASSLPSPRTSSQPPPEVKGAAVKAKSPPPGATAAQQAAEKAREKRSSRRDAAKATTEKAPAQQPAAEPPSKPRSQSKSQANGSAAPPPPPAAPRAKSQTAIAPSRSSHRAKLLVSRRMVYFQAFLIFLMALVGLSAGFLIGRALGPATQVASQKEPTFEITGSVKYRNTRGELVADFQSVAIALPVDKNAAIASTELGPNTRRDAGHQSEMAIHDLGGAYARASGDGSFALRVPKPGRYHLLLISKETKRAADRKVAEGDLEQLRRYFTSPTDLIGQSRYLWAQQEVREGRLVVLHVF
jgi:hypothetical protein